MAIPGPLHSSAEINESIYQWLVDLRHKNADLTYQGLADIRKNLGDQGIESVALFDNGLFPFSIGELIRDDNRIEIWSGLNAILKGKDIIELQILGKDLDSYGTAALAVGNTRINHIKIVGECNAEALATFLRQLPPEIQISTLILQNNTMSVANALKLLAPIRKHGHLVQIMGGVSFNSAVNNCFKPVLAENADQQEQHRQLGQMVRSARMPCARVPSPVLNLALNYASESAALATYTLSAKERLLKTPSPDQRMAKTPSPAEASAAASRTRTPPPHQRMTPPSAPAKRKISPVKPKEKDPKRTPSPAMRKL
jgi:hypothetical protein